MRGYLLWQKRNKTMNILDVIEGNLRYALNIRTSIMIFREENFCSKCPLAMVNNKYSGICSKALGGCGCKTGAKTSQNGVPCPKGFWGNNWINLEKFEKFLNENI